MNLHEADPLQSIQVADPLQSIGLMALVEAWVKLKYTKSEMNHFRGVKTHALWVIMLHPDPGHHLQ